MKLSKFSLRFDDWINPIAVKEMRQAVKGKFISSVLILFLLVELVIIGAVLIFHEARNEDFNIGRGVFMGLLGVLLATCLFFLPGYTAFRLSSERSDNNVDLFFITSLKPAQIIWGKLSSALVLTLLFFSAAMPFMSLTYLLRGLDLPSVFILLALDFMVVTICIQFGILLACAPGSVVSRGIRFLAGLIALGFTFGTTISMSGQMLFRGIGSSFGTWDFWGPALTVASFILMGIGLLFILSVTVITPSSANRAIGVRIYLVFIWLISGAVMLAWAMNSGSNDPLSMWVVGMVVMFGVSLFVSICERQHWGPRIIRKIPSSMFLRLPAFLFYSGAAGGVSYSIIMIAATLGLVELIIDAYGLKVDQGAYRATIALALYACCYALTALTIKRIFFSRSNRPHITALIGLFLLVTGSVVPMVIGFLVRSNPWHDLSPEWYLGNPFVVFWEDKIWGDSILFSSVWGVVIFAITVPWLIKHIRNFKPAVQIQGQTVEAINE